MEALAVARREQCRDRLVGIVGVAVRIGHALDEGIGRGSNGLLVQQAIEQGADAGDRRLDHDEAPVPPQYALGFAEDWSVKKLIKRVVMSHAYQLDSKFDPKNYEVDPDNAFVWRMAPRRRYGISWLIAGKIRKPLTQYRIFSRLKQNVA